MLFNGLETVKFNMHYMPADLWSALTGGGLEQSGKATVNMKTAVKNGPSLLHKKPMISCFMLGSSKGDQPFSNEEWDAVQTITSQLLVRFYVQQSWP